MPASDRKIVLVTRRTRLEELKVRFNTIGQAKFYIERLGADFGDYAAEDAAYAQVVREVRSLLEQHGRVQALDRGFLPNYLFAPDDLVLALGQDGLVANTLKYLSGQPLVGVNPDPARYDGVLLPFTPADLPLALPELLADRRPLREVTLARATLNNGLILDAVNDLFIGPRTHTSARYIIRHAGREEFHSSSGLIVSTGLGSTGWFRSLITGAVAIAAAVTGAPPAAKTSAKSAPAGKTTRPDKSTRAAPSAPDYSFAWDADHLQFTVREPFPSRVSTTSIVFGKITPANPLVLVSQMPETGFIFSDGVESDFLEFNSGAEATITLAPRKGRLAV